MKFVVLRLNFQFEHSRQIARSNFNLGQRFQNAPVNLKGRRNSFVK